MKRTIIIALALSASIGSQVDLRAAAATGSTKLGNLSFALTDTYQGPNARNWGIRDASTLLQVTNTVPSLINCAGAYKYVSSTMQLNNAAVLRAISSALTGTDYKQVLGSGNGVFTSKATLEIYHYDNALPAPPYPPYLPEYDNLGPADTMNGPRVPQVDLTASPFTETNVFVDVALATTTPLSSSWIWPNLHQIDWVDYDGYASRDYSGLDPSLWPKAQVFVSDASNANPLYQCVNVTPFFSFEEAYCYFCWDTVDRVTDGNFSTGTSGEVCIGSSCSTKGSGTTRWYMTIKFDNLNAVQGIYVANLWLDKYGPGTPADPLNIIAPWLPALLPYTWPLVQTNNANIPTTVKPLAIEAWLQFSVGGVVVYPWKFQTVNGVYNAFGTMTMAQATGFGNNPWCGVLVGSVKIVEQTDAKTPICYPTDGLDVNSQIFPWYFPASPPY